jgi:hypothetical protein
MISVAVDGNVVIEVGEMLQRMFKVASQLKLTVLEKPSCDETVIGPLVPVLPAFTFGNEGQGCDGGQKTKVGFVVTFIVNDCVTGACCPLAVA